MACKRCGLCCVVCDMRWEQMTEQNTPAIMDRMRWLNLHRCDTQIVTLKDGRKFSAMRIPLMCIRLDQDGDGKYKCKDYENRPQVCRDFLCEKARDVSGKPEKVGSDGSQPKVNSQGKEGN